VVGNPVRSEILALAPPEQRLQGRTGRLRLLIVGGSQGAQVFNRTLPEAVRAMPESARPEVWHQTGVRDEAAVREQYRAVLPEARVTAFIDDMAAAYAWADLVVCRAGAMTIAELAAAGVASLLVPLPSAADDHQTANARFLASREAAELVPQTEFTPSRLAELLTELGNDRATLTRMARDARSCAVTDATDTVAQICMESAHA
jgi:UDP-N-acetylglucosamine--N-acetylmuramyl-(pentapeptide) pyrophosphoryl-undecaprenol N-acetylglucosamine transferase